jgi:hypothetical protein
MTVTSSVQEQEVFVGLFDVLGFRVLVKNNELKKVTETYLAAKNGFEEGVISINGLHKHSKNKDRIKYHVFSDTFLIYSTGVNENCFLSMLSACDFLFMAAVEHSLPIRGSITRGPLIALEGVEIGKPIVEAYENEQRQDWIGCWIDDNCISGIDISKYLKDKSIVRYKVPLKSGEVRERLAFNWVKSVSWKVMFENRKNDFTLDQIRDQIKFTREVYSDWCVLRKLENTNRFVEFALSPEFVAEYKTGEL